jgi:NTP pyrophosphatase (non-canonical NTP hydrolase)
MKNLIEKSHGTAKEKGFWDTERNVSEMLMLIVSELAEAQEALRKDQFAEKEFVNNYTMTLSWTELTRSLFLKQLLGKWHLKHISNLLLKTR